jgi:hypothetical protein
MFEQGQKSSLSAIGVARHVSKDPLSGHNVALASAWMKECIKEHEFCSAQTRHRLPTRILHVGSIDKDPRLLEVASKGSPEKYAALSYCWGESLPLITTTTNLEQMKRGIPIDSLPHTLRDAVFVARKFGITYLWIDALCILQDSESDWITEAAQMGDIFANAYFVIRADAGSDCQSGFLLPRNNDSATGKTVVGFDSSKSKLNANGVFMRERRERGYDAVAHSTRKTRSRLSTRAWAFQERYRAARTLVFAEEEMAWECRTMTRCECKSGHLQSTTSFHQLDWRSTVETYSALSLTKSADRLPAFSGIAETFHNSRRTIGGLHPDHIVSGKPSDYVDYIGGIWRTELAQQLVWYLKSTETGSIPTSRRHTSYHAPTWSWASITGPITYHHHDVERKDSANFFVEDVEWAPATLNPYGAVREARMKARGRIVPVQILPPDESKYMHSQFLCPKAQDNIRLPFIADVIGETSATETYYFLIIILRDTLYAGLVLAKVDKEPNMMERVGFCCGNTVYKDLDDEIPEYLGEHERVGKVSTFLRMNSEMRDIVII